MFKPTKSGILSRVLGADSVGEKREVFGRTDYKASIAITPDGRVGIGTTIFAEDTLRVESASTNATSFSLKNTSTSGRNWVFQARSDGRFQLNDDNAGANRLSVNTLGYVGIGTNNAPNLFTIQSASTTCEFGIANSNLILIQRDNSGAVKTQITPGGTTTYFNGGSVGIGTTSPQKIFHVHAADANGNIKFTRPSTSETATLGTYYIDVTGNDFWVETVGGTNIIYIKSNSNGVYLANGATSWTANSDVRLKENVESITDSLTKICATRPVAFNWKSDGKQDYGFIAQELKTVFPEVVDGVEGELVYDEKGNIKSGFLGVSKEGLIPFIVKALQELSTKIDALEAKLG